FAVLRPLRHQHGSNLKSVSLLLLGRGVAASSAPSTACFRLHLLHLLALRLHVRAEVWLAEYLASIDPDFHASCAINREGSSLCVVDIRPNRVQRYAALEILLDPAHLSATEATGELDADSLRTHPHRRRERLLHRTTKRNATLELLCNVLGDEA